MSSTPIKKKPCNNASRNLRGHSTNFQALVARLPNKRRAVQAVHRRHTQRRAMEERNRRLNRASPSSINNEPQRLDERNIFTHLSGLTSLFPLEAVAIDPLLPNPPSRTVQDKLATASIVFVPLYLPESRHWVLVAIIPPTHILLFDSLDASPSAEIEQRWAVARETIAPYCDSRWNINAASLKRVPCTRQRNAADDGVAVLANALSLLNGQLPDFHCDYGLWRRVFGALNGQATSILGEEFRGSPTFTVPEWAARCPPSGASLSLSRYLKLMDSTAAQLDAMRQAITRRLATRITESRDTIASLQPIIEAMQQLIASSNFEPRIYQLLRALISDTTTGHQDTPLPSVLQPTNDTLVAELDANRTALAALTSTRRPTFITKELEGRITQLEQDMRDREDGRRSIERVLELLHGDELKMEGLITEWEDALGSC